MSVTTIALPPIRGESCDFRTISLDWNNIKRQWAFIHPAAASTTQSLTRELNKYAFDHILFSELYSGQQFLGPTTSGALGPGTAQQNVGSFSLVFANIQDNYPAFAALSAAKTTGTEVQIILVDQLEGGNRSSEAIGIKGSVFVFISTGTYVLIRLSLSAFCTTYRIFTQAIGKAATPSGALTGGCYDFKCSSTDAAKDPLKTLLEDTKKAISNGLSGGAKEKKD